MQLIVCDYPIPSEIIQAEEAIINCSKQKTHGELRKEIDKGIALYEHLLKSESVCRLIDTNQRTHQANYTLLLRLQEEFREDSAQEDITSSVKTRIDKIIDDDFCHHVPRIEIIQSLCATYQKKLSELQASIATKIYAFEDALITHKTIDHQNLKQDIADIINLAQTLALQIGVFIDAIPEKKPEYIEIYKLYRADSKLTIGGFYLKYLLPQMLDSKRKYTERFAAAIFATSDPAADKLYTLLQLLEKHWQLQNEKNTLMESKNATNNQALKVTIGIANFGLYYLCATNILSSATFGITHHILTAGTNLVIRAIESLHATPITEEVALQKFDHLDFITGKLLSFSLTTAITNLNIQNRDLKREIVTLKTEQDFCNVAQGTVSMLLPLPPTNSFLETLTGFGIWKACGKTLGGLGDFLLSQAVNHTIKPDALP